MAITTAGQFSIISYNDNITLTGTVISSQPRLQQYNPDNGTYTPDWNTSNCVLTPTLYRSGSTSDLISPTLNSNVTVAWYEVIGGTETAISTDANYTVGTKTLTIETNKMTIANPALSIVCICSYYDASTKLTLTYKEAINFNLSRNGTGVADAFMYAPLGDVFKNDTVASLKLHCDLWRGKNIDNTAVLYAWFQQDKTVFAPTTLSVAATQGTNTITLPSIPVGMVVGSDIKVGADTAKTISGISGKVVTLSGNLATGTYSIGTSVINPYYDSDSGVGWGKLADVDNYISGTTTNEITIYPVQIGSCGNAVFKCQIKDTDSSSPTYNHYFYDKKEIDDVSDPIQIMIVSTGGDVMKNSSGSSTLTAKVYRHGTELDAGGTTYTYTWTIYDKNNTKITFNGGASSKTGKSISVGSLDVGTQAIFKVAIS